MGSGTRSGGNRGNSPAENDPKSVGKAVEKVCTTLFQKFEENLNRRFEALETKIDNITALQKDVDEIKTQVRKNSDDIIKMQNRIDNLEQKTKCRTLRFNGVPEDQDDETKLGSTILSIINEKLKIVANLNIFESLFRVGQKGESPRSVLVNFNKVSVRNQILQARKKLKGSEYTIYEDLTASKYNLLRLAKEKYGKNKAWTTSGKVYVWDESENKKILINSEDMEEKGDD